MEKEQIKKILVRVRKGVLTPQQALTALQTLPFEDLGFAKLDTHRQLRQGFPEVIYCEGKDPDHIRGIVERLRQAKLIMATRASEDVFRLIQAVRKDAVYFRSARIVLAGRPKRAKHKKRIAVLSAGTADIPVAEEAAVTAEVLGQPVDRVFDVGVAGVHRLLANKDKVFAANVLIVVAGMEGALASIVGGMAARPVIAVPTSVGYGAHFQGLAPLLTMLNSCAPGVAVVNIDNGFGAGYMAAMINRG